MTNSTGNTYTAFRSAVVVHGGVLALLAGAALLLASPTPAAALDTTWREACRAPVVTPGYGDMVRNYNCSRQSDCQALANARGTTVNEAGCFGVSPEAPAHGPSAASRQR
jgi:hypothetical protein